MTDNTELSVIDEITPAQCPEVFGQGKIMDFCERIRKEAIEAERRAAKEKAEAELRAERAAAEERARIEAERAAAEKEAERKAANKRHRAKINREALADLVKAGADEALAKSLVEAIARGQVRHMTINY